MIYLDIFDGILDNIFLVGMHVAGMILCVCITEGLVFLIRFIKYHFSSATYFHKFHRPILSPTIFLFFAILEVVLYTLLTMFLLAPYSGYNKPRSNFFWDIQRLKVYLSYIPVVLVWIILRNPKIMSKIFRISSLIISLGYFAIIASISIQLLIADSLSTNMNNANIILGHSKEYFIQIFMLISGIYYSSIVLLFIANYLLNPHKKRKRRI